VFARAGSVAETGRVFQICRKKQDSLWGRYDQSHHKKVKTTRFSNQEKT
jgi:hypothetical protein